MSDVQSDINLAVLQRSDHHVMKIIDSATQVAVYSYSQATNEWKKCDIEGSFFIFQRNIFPTFGFIIMNRLNTENFMEYLTSDFDVQLQIPYLLYRNKRGLIQGVWFYNHHECIRLNTVLRKLIEMLKQVHSSVPIVPNGLPLHKVENDIINNKNQITNAPGKDIVKMLNNAHQQFHKISSVGTVKPQPTLPMDDLLSKLVLGNNKAKAASNITPITSNPIPFRSVSVDHSENSDRTILQRNIVNTGNDDVHPVLQKLLSTSGGPVMPSTPLVLSSQPKTPVFSFGGTSSDVDQNERPIIILQKRRLTDIDDVEVDDSRNFAPIGFHTPETVTHKSTSTGSRSIDDSADNISLSFSQSDLLEQSGLSLPLPFVPLLTPQDLIRGSSYSVENVNGLPLVSSSEDQQNLLTKEQLIQAMKSLLDNDDEFVDRLHSAYVCSAKRKNH